MSRIGRLPIAVPAGVDVTLDGRTITVKGPKGTLTRDLPPRIEIAQEDGTIVVSRPTENKLDKSLHGLTRTLVNNMVVGVTDGYRKGLEIVGVGYRAQKVGEKLQLALGYSHPIEIEPPKGISFEVETPLRLAVVGIDKETGKAVIPLDRALALTVEDLKRGGKLPFPPDPKDKPKGK